MKKLIVLTLFLFLGSSVISGTTTFLEGEIARLKNEVTRHEAKLVAEKRADQSISPEKRAQEMAIFLKEGITRLKDELRRHEEELAKIGSNKVSQRKARKQKM